MRVKHQKRPSIREGLMPKRTLFISQSGTESASLGNYFADWIRLVLGDNAKKWISTDPKDLPQGPYDHLRIVEAARKAHMCISIITPENCQRPWMLFEPGIFYGLQKPVYALLCGGLTHSHLKTIGYPIEGYGAYPTKSSILNLLLSINNNGIKQDEKLLKTHFEAHYMEFEQKYNEIFEGQQNSLVSAEENLLKAIIKS